MKRGEDMTRKECKEHPDYLAAKQKVIDYPHGFEFTLNYASIPKAKLNALNILMDECCKEKLIESIKIGLTLTGEVVDETYRRL